MIVRESPAKKKNTTGEQWPPKSPRDVLLSSPSRLRRIDAERERKRQLDHSPSPSKRRRLSQDFVPVRSTAPVEDGSGDDDEETLRLQLQEIQAKLKLKKLQKLKQNAPAGTLGSSSQSRRDETDMPSIAVPSSPKQIVQKENVVASPRRIQLGIDKGLKASDVSLKKPPKNRGKDDSRRPPIPNIKSFSQRLTEVRSNDVTKQTRRDHLNKSRSKTFGVELPPPGLGQPIDIKERASERATAPSRSYSIKDVMAERDQRRKNPGTTNNTQNDDPESSSHRDNLDSDFDDTSGMALSKRITPKSTVSQATEGKVIYRIPELLKKVTAPDYEPPDDDDYVVVGIIASKTEPYNKRSQTNVASNADPNEQTGKTKFMVLHLTDLKWELDLFLFDTGFEKFWKLTVGTVIAILNPGIMPPKSHLRDSGRFSLKLSSSEDQVLELGMAEDLAWCKSIKKDGNPCGQWIDRRMTEFCEFHVNLQIEKARSKRMEINGISGIQGFLNKNRSDGWEGGSSKNSRGGKGKGKKEPAHGHTYDAFNHEHAYVMPRAFSNRNNSTAKMLDREDYAQTGKSREEAHRKRMQDKAKEKELARQLASCGNGVGAEYSRMRSTNTEDATDSSQAHPQFQAISRNMVGDAAALNLVNPSAAAVHLSPVKRRRRTAVAEPVGWAGAFKRGLPGESAADTNRPAPKSPLKTALKPSTTAAGPPSPTKATRFMLEQKGIRRPGRDSLPTTLHDDDDDDDGLEIIR